MNKTSYILVAAICLIGLAYECSGYGPQSQQPVQPYNTQHFPRQVYGTPPSSLSRSSLEFNTPTYNPAHSPVPVLKAVVRTLEPIGKNYEVKLSQTLAHHQYANADQTYTQQQNHPQTPPGQLLLNNQPYQPAVVATHFASQGNQIAIRDNSLNTQLQQSNSAVNGAVSNYISQSEASQLDHYFEKQNPVGEVRAYTRLISTCYNDGRCDQQKLGSGQVDAKHQIIVLSARTSVQPQAKKCGTANSPGFGINHNSVSDEGVKQIGADSATKPIRPRNRRLYPYTETIIARDPFN